MSRRSFLSILAKLHAKIKTSKQDTAKSIRINVADACRLLIRECEQPTQYDKIGKLNETYL